MFMKSTRIMESLTTIPASATIPKRVTIPKGLPLIISPSIAPINAKGTVNRMIRG